MFQEEICTRGIHLTYCFLTPALCPHVATVTRGHTYWTHGASILAVVLGWGVMMFPRPSEMPYGSRSLQGRAKDGHPREPTSDHMLARRPSTWEPSVGFRLLSVTLSPVLPFLPLNAGPAPGHGDTALITSVAPQHSAGRAPPPGSCCTSSGFALPIPGASTQGSATFVACRCPPRLRPTYTPRCQARPLWPHAACTLPVSGLCLLRARHTPPRRDPVSHPRCC